MVLSWGSEIEGRVAVEEDETGVGFSSDEMDAEVVAGGEIDLL
jgi:hypothetical protein